MGRPAAAFPVPRVRFESGSAYVYWSWRRKVYSACAGRVDADRASVICDQVALVLRGVMDQWPDEVADAPAVLRYRRDRAGPGAVDDLIARYIPSLRAEVSEGWFYTSVRYLRRLEADYPDLSAMQPADGQDVIDSLAVTAAPGTRNKYLQVYKRFFDWAVRVAGVGQNPFVGIRYVQERNRAVQITYLEKDERQAVLDAAAGLPFGASVWLAIGAGLRRGECFALNWSDIHWENHQLTVRKSKVGHPRTVPIPSVLVQYLEQLPRKSGPVVGALGDLTLRTVTCNLQALIAEQCPDVDPALIRYNPFRHTFATMHVQAGVPVDTVAAWIGDTIETTRRRYARFVPKDQRDLRVDLAWG